MNNSEVLYGKVFDTLSSLVSVSHVAHLKNWVWIVVGLLQGQSVALPQIAVHIPGEAAAESRVTTLRRWLKNLKIEIWPFYRPVLERVLEGWQAVEATVVLDGVMVFGDRWQIFRLSLLHGNRAIPLTWKGVPGTGVIPVETMAPLLRQVADLLRGRVACVCFLADRGFRDVDGAALCREVGWHYDIRLPRNTIVHLPDGTECRIDALDVPPGESRFFPNVSLTQKTPWPANLSVTWTEGDDAHPAEWVAVMSDRPAGPSRLAEYGLRMAIEQSFRDDKSGGFDLAHTRLCHPERLERLLLAVAIATLWCHELGEFVVLQGDACRREIDPGPERELSLFQLGLRWLKRCLSTALHRLAPFVARLTPIHLPPVIQPIQT